MEEGRAGSGGGRLDEEAEATGDLESWRMGRGPSGSVASSQSLEGIMRKMGGRRPSAGDEQRDRRECGWTGKGRLQRACRVCSKARDATASG
jgi:hypothetical protein